MQSYSNNLQDQFGNGIPSGTVTVYYTGTNTKPQLYSDDGVTQTSNPVTADSLGRYSFYVADGHYDLVGSAPGYTGITLTDVAIVTPVSSYPVTVADVKALTPDQAAALGTVTTQGYYAAGDGGAGAYWWNSTDTTADNGGTVIAPNAGGTGRWNLLVINGIQNVRQWGAYGDGTHNDEGAIQGAINSISNSSGTGLGGIVLFPAGKYLITSTLTVYDHVTLKGVLGYQGEWDTRTGVGSVLINNTSGVNTVTFYGGTGGLALNSSIDGLAFEGTGTGSHISLTDTGNGIYEVAIRNSSFLGKSNGVLASGTVYIIRIMWCGFHNQTSWPILITNSSGTGGHSIYIEENSINDNGSNTVGAIRFTGTAQTSNVIIKNNVINGFRLASTNVIDFNTAVQGFTIIDNWFEQNNGSGSVVLNLSGTAGNVFGNTFNNDWNGILMTVVGTTFIGPNTFGSSSGTYSISVTNGSAANFIMPQQADKPVIVSGVNEGNWIYDQSDGVTTAVRSVSGTSYTVAANDDSIYVTTSGAFTLFLPAISGASSGRKITIKKVDSAANTVTVTSYGSETIDGAANYALATQNKYVTVQSDGTNWKVIANN